MSKSSPPMAANVKDEAQDILLQIERAIQKGQGGKLISFADLPTPWHINPYIRSGYRFTATIRESLKYSLKMSNESFNILSHVLGLVGVLVAAFELYPIAPPWKRAHMADTVIWSMYLIASAICFACSVIWHSFKGVGKHKIMKTCASVDMTGVTFMISATSLMAEYTGFYNETLPRILYMTLSSISAAICFVVVWSPRILNPSLAWFRVTTFTLLGLTGLLPFIHMSITKGFERALLFYTPIFFDISVPIFGGAVIYATKFPESWWPGHFDFLGSSHNIWHIAVIVSILNGYITMNELFLMVHEESREGRLGT